MADELPALASAQQVLYQGLGDHEQHDTAGNKSDGVHQQTPSMLAKSNRARGLLADAVAPAGAAGPQQHAPEPLGDSTWPSGLQLQGEGASSLPRTLQAAAARQPPQDAAAPASTTAVDRPPAAAFYVYSDPAQKADRFQNLYDATRKRLRHAEDKVLQHKSAHRALERVCEDLRTRLAQAEEHAVRARERDAAILAREAAVAALAEAKADAELLRARLAACEAAAAVGDDGERRARALGARIADLEHQLSLRDRLLRDRDAERTDLCALIARYEKELQTRETSILGRPSAVGRSRRLEPKEDLADYHSALPRRPNLGNTASRVANESRAFLEMDDTDGDCLVATQGRFQGRSRSPDPEQSDPDDTLSLQTETRYEEGRNRLQHGFHLRAGSQSRWHAVENAGLRDVQDLEHDLANTTMDNDARERAERWRHIHTTRKAAEKALRTSSAGE